MPTQAPKENFGARANAPANSDQDEIARLTQMRDRLVSLSNEAHSMRAHIPSEFEGDVERIQLQMQRLGERIAELSAGSDAPKATREQTRVPTDEVILLGGPCRIDDPWDEASAAALTQIYESGEPFHGGGSTAGSNAMQRSPSGPQRGMVLRNLSRVGAQQSHEERQQAPEGGAGPTWVNERFAEIAQRIEQSLAAIRPDSSLLRLGHRFDHLEQRMTAVLSNVASKADLKELRIAEAQVEDISAQLEQLRRQLARLNSIDSHINRLSERLSDDKLAGLAGPGGAGGRDEARLAAIDANVQALSARLSRDQLAELIKENARPGDQGDLRGLLENLINERRHNDENNASMMETMQQAIIRVLDRIDGLELAQQNRAAPTAHPPHEPLQAEVERFTAELQGLNADPAYEVPRASMFAQESEPQSPVKEPQSQFEAVPFDMETAFALDESAPVYAAPDASPRAADNARGDTLRHDFIADAHRAKLKAATRLDSSGLSAGERSSESVPQQGSVKPRARRSIFNFRSPRVLMSILTLLAMIPAAIFFMPRTSVDSQDSTTVKSTLPAFFGDSMKVEAPAAKDAAPALPNGNGSVPAELPRKQSEQLNPSAPSTNALGERASPAQDIGYDRIDTASIPGRVTLGTDSAATAKQFMQASLAPGAVGAASPDNGVEGDTALAPPDNKPLSLPPATVGPYSLRLAAAHGDASAQFEVAVRMAEAKGDDQDLKGALQWYQRSAASGFAMAQFRLGTLYERGLGVKADPARARIWYTRAAQQGNVKATHNLAVLLAGRGGATPDYAQAAKLFSESAAHGLTDSQFNLAMLYESGLGVPRDLKEAYKWLLLASRSGDKEAASQRDALKLQLSDADRAVAETAAKSFRAKTVNPVANDFRAAGQAWRPGASTFARQG